MYRTCVGALFSECLDIHMSYEDRWRQNQWEKIREAGEYYRKLFLLQIGLRVAGFSIKYKYYSYLSCMQKIEKSVTEHQEIKKMSNKKEKSLEALSLYQINQLEWLIDAIWSSWLDEFMDYIRSPWKMLWPNFVAWVARGFGALVGATIVIALIWWTLSTLIDLPLIGKKLAPYIENVQSEFSKYTESTNYRPHFERIETTLNSIDESLQKQEQRNIMFSSGTIR